MVDGAARPGTVMTLSHWAHSATPRKLRKDLSAEIVLRALEEGYVDTAGTDLATIDHYDEDGVAALALLLLPGLAERHSGVLVEAARVGDFGVVRDRRGALVAFGIATLGDALRTPLHVPRPARDARTGHLDMCALATRHALSIIDELASDPQRFESLWRDEAAALDAAMAGMGRWVRIEEIPEHDLAIVRVDPAASGAGLAVWGDHVIHPAAVYSSTARLRIATVAGDRLEVRFRYESWVRLASRRPRLRVDLTSFASILDSLEPRGAALGLHRGRRYAPGLAHGGRGAERHLTRSIHRAAHRATCCARRRTSCLGSVPRGRVTCGCQETGRSHSGNQRDSSGSVGRSVPMVLFSLSSISVSRCSRPVGTNG